jgi:hypothetical protein
MKKIALLSLMVILAVSLTECKKDKTNKYAGTYTGTLISAGQSKENQKLIFISGIQDEENLYLYGYLLTKQSETQYVLNDKILITLIQLITPITSGELDKVSATFTFTDGGVEMNMTYNLINLADVSVVKFSGTKQQ